MCGTLARGHQQTAHCGAMQDEPFVLSEPLSQLLGIQSGVPRARQGQQAHARRGGVRSFHGRRP